jgi:acetylornithine deacetylase/succinyl-diaminopimelate desuccinylase-like protein
MSQDDPQSAIGAFLDRAHAEQTGFLAELVKGPSDNPPGDCARHAMRAAELLERLGFAVERHPVPRALVRAPGVTCRVRRVMLAEALRHADGLERLVEPLRRHAEAVMGEPIPTYGVPLCTNARHDSATGVPTVLYGAGPRTLPRRTPMPPTSACRSPTCAGRPR